MAEETALEAIRAELDALRREVRMLKDVHEVRTLHFKYGYYIDLCLYDEAVDLFADDGIVYFLNGIAEDLFVPIFAVGRVPGWTVQVLEQLENNILLRPLTLYNGPEPREYVPVEKRSVASAARRTA